MGRRTITIAFCLTLATIPALCVHSKHVRAGETSQVTLLRTPHEGIQQQTVLDRDGVLHMIYFKGDASGGDIEYVSRKPNGKDSWEPIRVNSEPGLSARDLPGAAMLVWRFDTLFFNGPHKFPLQAQRKMIDSFDRWV